MDHTSYSDVKTAKDFEDMLDELYAESGGTIVKPIIIPEKVYNQIYVITDSDTTGRYHLTKCRTCVEIIHARGVLIIINIEYS